MMSSQQKKTIQQLVEDTREQRAKVRKLAAAGKWKAAEPEPERFRAFVARHTVRVPVRGKEAIQGPTMDLQPASFLAEGAEVRRAVAFVEASTPRESTNGSGFLISPALFITNQHVLRDATTAASALLTFDLEMDERRVMRGSSVFTLDPQRFALFSDETALDYAVVGIGRCVSGNPDVAEFGYLPLGSGEDRHVIGMPVNIVQHPGGRPKMVAIRNNLLTHRTPRTLLYETDTECGSSGAPVLNDDWDVVALHHWAAPMLERVDENGVQIPTTVNEGVRISAIHQDLKRRLGELAGEQRKLLEAALSLYEEVATSGRRLSPRPRPGPEADGKAGAAERQEIVSTVAGSEGTRLPIEITVRIGGGGGAVVEQVRRLSTRPAPELSRGAERVRIDRDYSNRPGYQKSFIPGVLLDLPKPRGALAGMVAPLRASEPNFEEGLLEYQHFCVKLHRTRRMAIFTATNIDGETYLRVDRDTGEVVGPEGDTWYDDPRISDGYYLGRAFYREWSTYFDRGHLTRRTDPTWGTELEAERANTDTFHLTNCAPQHFRFNQTTRFWQGAERYVLENGMLAPDSASRVTVFQGPLFDDDADLWADDVQIPSSFFKVIVWRAKGGLRSVGLIVHQRELLAEERRYLGQPKDVPSVDVSQWRAPVRDVARRANLDFGSDVENADTSQRPEQPRVGGEALRRIQRFEDILA